MKVLTIHSLAVHGNASMKILMHLLGDKILPVISLYLSGLTNLPGIIRTEVQFEAILENTFQLARQRGELLILYIGYLGNAAQVDTILRLMDEYDDLIEAVVCDPVSGDHGRIYVPEDVVNAWPQLLAKADWAMPNYTELKLYSGLGKDQPADKHLLAFHKKFPNLNLLATSFPHKKEIAVYLLKKNGKKIIFSHKPFRQNYGGTGDAFGGRFVEEHFFFDKSPERAMQIAGRFAQKCVRHSMEMGSDELLLV